MRKEIEDFAKEMEETMAEHDCIKGDSWKDCEIDYLRKKVIEEFSEWSMTAICEEEDYELESMELIDLANICMMLYHRRTSKI